MTQVYIIFEGEYSEKHIVKCFSTKEQAERFKNKLMEEDKEQRITKSRKYILELNKPETFDEWKSEHKPMRKEHWGFSYNVVIECYNCRGPVVYDVDRDIVVDAPARHRMDEPISSKRIKKLTPHETTCFKKHKNEMTKNYRHWASNDYNLFTLEQYEIG